MNEATVLNNNAILYLQMGNAFEACNLLTEASCICTRMADAAESRRKSCLVHRGRIMSWVNVAIDDFLLVKRDGSHPSLYHFTPAIRKACCQKEDQDVICCERKHCQECVDDTNDCPCSIAPMVWYNLALTCQILGNEFGGGTTKDGVFYFERSTYLYKKVLNVCSMADGSTGLSTLLMAVLNNQACICYEMGKQDHCSALLGRLKHTLQAISLRYSSSSRPYHHRNWGIFHVNLLMMMDSGRAAAAA
jgi:hypothetical protein